jgi:hypothetical protein
MSVELVRTLRATVTLASAAKKRMIHRSLNYHRRFLPDQFVFENAHKWYDLVALCESRANRVGHVQPAYPFTTLCEKVASEWLDEDLAIGNIASLGEDLIVTRLSQWVVRASQSGSSI